MSFTEERMCKRYHLPSILVHVSSCRDGKEKADVDRGNVLARNAMASLN